MPMTASNFSRNADDAAVEKAANAQLQPKGMRCTLSRQGDDCVLTVQYGSMRSTLRRSFPFTDPASIVEATNEWVANRMGGLHRYVDMDEAS